jgi:hypothetical protein
MKAKVNVFLAVADHGKKHIHLGFYTGTGGCGCSLKSAPDVARNMVGSV